MSTLTVFDFFNLNPSASQGQFLRKAHDLRLLFQFNFECQTSINSILNIYLQGKDKDNYSYNIDDFYLKPFEEIDNSCQHHEIKRIVALISKSKKDEKEWKEVSSIYSSTQCRNEYQFDPEIMNIHESIVSQFLMSIQPILEQQKRISQKHFHTVVLIISTVVVYIIYCIIKFYTIK